MTSKLAYTAEIIHYFSHWHTQPPCRPILLLFLHYKNSMLNSSFNLPSLPQHWGHQALLVFQDASDYHYHLLTTSLEALNSLRFGGIAAQGPRPCPPLQVHLQPTPPVLCPISAKVLLFHTYVMLFHDSITLHILIPPPKIILSLFFAWLNSYLYYKLQFSFHSLQNPSPIPHIAYYVFSALY